MPSTENNHSTDKRVCGVPLQAGSPKTKSKTKGMSSDEDDESSQIFGPRAMRGCKLIFRYATGIFERAMLKAPPARNSSRPGRGDPDGASALPFRTCRIPGRSVLLLPEVPMTPPLPGTSSGAAPSSGPVAASPPSSAAPSGPAAPSPRKLPASSPSKQQDRPGYKMVVTSFCVEGL